MQDPMQLSTSIGRRKYATQLDVIEAAGLSQNVTTCNSRKGATHENDISAGFQRPVLSDSRPPETFLRASMTLGRRLGSVPASIPTRQCLHPTRRLSPPVSPPAFLYTAGDTTIPNGVKNRLGQGLAWTHRCDNSVSETKKIVERVFRPR